MTERYSDFYSCDNCEAEFIHLIDRLVENIRHLESKVVFLRYTLSNYLPHPDAELLLSDIFSDLSARCYDFPAYQKYMEKCCNGLDPADDEEYCKCLAKLARGESVANL